jgi:hypothetical protein
LLLSPCRELGTPATSFQIGNSIGNKWERFAILRVLCENRRMSNWATGLKWLLRGSIFNDELYQQQVAQSLQWGIRPDLPKRFEEVLKTRKVPAWCDHVMEELRGPGPHTLFSATLGLARKLDGRSWKRLRPACSQFVKLLRECLEHIKKITQGTVSYSEPRSPVVGVVEAPLGRGSRKIEVLRDVKGLGPQELEDVVQILIGNTIVNVLAPTKVLKAKICNAVTLDQFGRDDVKHVRIMILCVREFILDLLPRSPSPTSR